MVHIDYDWIIYIILFDLYNINIYLTYESPHIIDLFEYRLDKLSLYCEFLNT